MVSIRLKHVFAIPYLGGIGVVAGCAVVGALARGMRQAELCRLAQASKEIAVLNLDALAYGAFATGYQSRLRLDSELQFPRPTQRACTYSVP